MEREQSSARAGLSEARRVVVKVGSALLHDDDRVFSKLGFQLARARDAGVEVVIVSSGAIALGWPALDYEERPRDLAGLQAAAAAGQGLLTSRWTQALGGHAPVAQVLLTHGDLEHRRRGPSPARRPEPGPRRGRRARPRPRP